MANAREIKARINSVTDTRKITNAMYLIASTKTKKARKSLDETRPYFDALRMEIKRIFRKAGDVESKYFYPPDGETPLNGTYGILVITADKGLAGAYNQNVIRETLRLLEEHPDSKLFVVGGYGRRYFTNHNIPIEKNFYHTAQNPTMERARQISTTLLGQFGVGKLEKIFVVYTDQRSGLLEEAVSTRLLPFHRKQFASNVQEKAVTTPFEFVPSCAVVLDNIMESYISGFIYSALVDSFCCEQSARMTAMNSANDNADNLLSELSLTYNHLRQSAITQEITEVSAGARAQRNG